MFEMCALSDLITLQRGHDLPTNTRALGKFPVIGASGITGSHDIARYLAPGVTIGRSGASIGTAVWVNEPYWPLNTCLFVRDFKGNDPRWIYYLLRSINFTGFNSGSAQPSLNRNYLSEIPVPAIDLSTQQNIGEVLGLLDDKIEANTKLANTADTLATALYLEAVQSCKVFSVLTDLANPILGSTPSRAKPEFWLGTNNWISAKDITSAPNKTVFTTIESISSDAIVQTRAKPLPAGSVILTARGTVGAIARLAEPSSFNQSCYGFVPTEELPSALLFQVIQHSIAELRRVAYGSVFDSITTKTLQMVQIPKLTSRTHPGLVRKLGTLQDQAVSLARENNHLIELRDYLLPRLMSGKIIVGDTKNA